MKNIDAVVGRHVRAARGKVSIRELARRIGGSPEGICTVESGRHGISVARFVKIAHALNLRPSTLLRRIEKELLEIT